MSSAGDFSISYEEGGRELVKELGQEILSKGAWATVMFLYQDRGKTSDEWSEPKVRIQRYRKRDGKYLPHSRFNVSSAKQAEKLIEVLKRWYEI